MTVSIREEFNAWWRHDDQRELRLSCAEGWGLYIWQASRAAIEVELPDPRETLAGPSLYAQFKESVEAAGIKVKP